VSLPVKVVLFDWRGTLVVTMSWSAWVERALQQIGRDRSPDAVARIKVALAAAMEHPDVQRAWDRVDESADVHRETYARLFRVAGLDADLGDALYTIESDPAYNPVADDVPETLKGLNTAGERVGIVSDIHVDLRPAFADAGLADLVDSFVLSFEHGVQKPNPEIFRVALEGLAVGPADTLMVGDRASHDGAAVELGIPTVLVPQLAATSHRRLSVALRACGVPTD
jgi:FMN phosphatase YigB (HAD superfamily)